MTEKQNQGVLPALYNMTKHQALIAGIPAGVSVIADIATHANPGVMFVGGLVALAIGVSSKEVAEMVIPGSNPDQVRASLDVVVQAVTPEIEEEYVDQRAISKIRRLLHDKHPDLYETQDIMQPGAVPAQPKDDMRRVVDESEEDEYLAPLPEPAMPELETLFAQAHVSREVSGVRRLTIKEIVSHTERNSYKVWIGRSLTQPNNPAISINFRKRHIKLIGASQKGKSSMAAALLEAILSTHDKEHVLLALLDMEDQTSRLFANAPHLAELLIDNKTVLLHARSREEVLEHLEYIVALMDYRYTLSKSELAQEPILLVYLEEFIALKDYFKQRIDSVIGKEEKEQAKKDYARLVFCIKEVARRGLKVLVQFLMCAQVDYRDEDLQEALINVTSGMSFAVRVSAAQAAGFYQSDLLNRNAKENHVGQAVVEMPDCKDLILSPEYDLEQRLIALEEQEKQATPIYKKQGPVNLKMPIYGNVNASVNASTSAVEAHQASQHLHLLVNDTPEHETPGEPPVNVNVNADIRKTIKRLVEMGTMPHNKIAKAVGLDGRYYPTYKQVCKEMGIATEKDA